MRRNKSGVRRIRAWLLVELCGLLVLAPTLGRGWPAGQSARAEAPSPVLPDLVTRETVRRIERGLRYLDRTQRADGSWLNSGGWGSYPTVMTSLAGMAFLAGGSTPESGPYAHRVSKALDYVLSQAAPYKGDQVVITDSEGGGGRSMYGHGFGMLFLAQCYGMEGDKTSARAQRLQDVLEGAVKLTADSQSEIEKNTAGGWYYTPESNADEGSVTVTQLQALRACRNVGIAVPGEVIQKAVRYLKICQNADGGICYSFQSQGSSRPPISAAAIACFYSAGLYDRQTGGTGEEAEMVEKLVQYCKGTISENYTGGHFFYAHLYYSQSLYQRGGADWRTYYPRISKQLAQQQMPDGNWNGDGIGEVYGTAIALMILQLPYGYLPIMQK